jgi:hypothetical protein
MLRRGDAFKSLVGGSRSVQGAFLDIIWPCLLVTEVRMDGAPPTLGTCLLGSVATLYTRGWEKREFLHQYHRCHF